MKIRFFAFVFTLCSFFLAKAQFPGGGGGYGNSMMSPQMQNMPQGNSGPSKPDEPPHGGEVKEVGKYNIEVVFDPFNNEEKLNVWLLKGNYKPAKAKATAKALIKYPKLNDGKGEETVDMTLAEDRFFCNVSNPSATFTAFITITVKGKEYKTVFNQRGMEGK